MSSEEERALEYQNQRRRRIAYMEVQEARLRGNHAEAQRVYEAWEPLILPWSIPDADSEG